MTDTHPSGAPWRNFYGRFKGHGLKDSQQRYLYEDLEELEIIPRVPYDVVMEKIYELDLKEKF